MTLRRMKTYTGGQGYVYQYYFVGQREALTHVASGGAMEFVFDVTADRKATFAVSVFVSKDALEQWAGVHGRNLTAAEQYGAVKMRLFQAFDEIEDMRASGRRLLLDALSLEALLSVLGVS